MKTFVPKKKMSKKARKQENARGRGDWNGVVPVTRVIENGRRPERARARELARRQIREDLG